jgi:hypothetical protein
MNIITLLLESLISTSPPNMAHLLLGFDMRNLQSSDLSTNGRQGSPMIEAIVLILEKPR